MKSGPWRRIDVVDETGSTNADLLARAAAGEDIDGAVLIAESQTAGRGRHGRTWSTPPRSQIALSVGVGVGAVPSEAWGWLPLLTGVAVVDAVAEVAGVTAGLKWPNDVLVGTGKLAGILAEVAAPAPVVVVGLGLNVDRGARSRRHVAGMLGAAVDRDGAHRGGAVATWRPESTRWRAAGGADATLAADYRSRSVTIGNRVRASLPGDRTVEGVADDIDEVGQAAHRHRRQTVLTVSAGDITHLRPVRAIEFLIVGYPDNVLAGDEQGGAAPPSALEAADRPGAGADCRRRPRRSVPRSSTRPTGATAKTVVLLVILAVWLLLVGWLIVWPFLNWLTTHFVITDRRVMFRHGLLTRQGIDIPLARINSVEFRHGLIDRMVRTGTLIIESASQDPLEFHDIPRVERVHSLLYHEVFDTLGSEESDSWSSGGR